MANDAYLPIGRVSGPHGINGNIKVKVYSGDPANLCHAKKVVLGPEKDGPFIPLKVRKVKRGLKYTLLSIEGVDNRDQASMLTGKEVWIAKSDLRSLEEDEYYWYQLIGLIVKTNSGYTLGKLKHIFETGANDVYVVCQGDEEYLIPAVADVVEKVDLEQGVVIVNLPPGIK